MRVLIISQWYAPEPDGRVSAFAKALVQRGYDVDVITAFPHYPIGRLYDGYTLKWRQREVCDGVNLLRLPIFPDHSRSAIKRAFNYLSFFLSLITLGPWMVKKPDVIWGYTVLVGMPVLFYSRLFGAPCILEIADLWPDALSQSGMLGKGMVSRLGMKMIGTMCNFVYQRSDALSVLNPGFKTILERRYVDGNKISVIEGWADCGIYRPMERDVALSSVYRLEGKFTVLFAGNMGFAQGLDTVIDAAALLVKEKDIEFIFVGNGVVYQSIEEKARKLGLKNVKFAGWKPEEQMARYFSIADALLVHLRNEEQFAITIPAKTKSYLACAKPIIMAVRGAGAQLVEENKCGLACQPENPQSLADAILSMRNMTEGERKAMGMAGKKLYVKRYMKSMLIGKMDELLVHTAERKMA